MATAAERAIQKAYEQALGRKADPEGLKFYVGQLESGRSIRDIAADLSYSEQGKAYAAKTSAYIPKEIYKGASHKVEGVELVPGAPGYDKEKAMPILKKYVAPQSKAVQAYLSDIGEFDPETEAAIKEFDQAQKDYDKVQSLVRSGQITPGKEEAYVIDVNRGVERPDITGMEVRQPTTPEEQTQATLDRSRAALAEEERMAAERAAARQRARMRRARPLLSEQRLAPELQL